MHKTDYDTKHATRDADGGITAKNQSGVNTDAEPRSPIEYKGFTINIGIGQVKVWQQNGHFFGDYPDIVSAKEAIDAK